MDWPRLARRGAVLAAVSAALLGAAEPRDRPATVAAMESIMGVFPGRDPAKAVHLDLIVEEETDRGSYVVRRISYQSEPGDRTPAYLCIPKVALDAPAPVFPAVLCLHPTDTAMGAGVAVGLGSRPNRAYAAELAARGFVTIAPNYPHLAGYAPDLAGSGYASGTMKAVWDNTRALDVLESLPFVRRGRFGAIGHSLGGHNALFTAVFEPRIVAVATSCGFDSFADYYDGNPAVWVAGKGWCQERYMPRLAGYAGRLGEIPFDFDDILAALAPRPVYISAPLRDANFRWHSVARLVALARPAYARLGAGNALRVEHPDSEHDFPAAQREAAYALFAEMLK